MTKSSAGNASRKILILMRHAKSNWDVAALKDIHRPLSRRGERDAETMGQWLSEQIAPPQLVLCSSAKRAVQTAQLALPAFDLSQTEVEYWEDLYLVSEQHLYRLAMESLNDVSRLMMIGHNPGMEMLLTKMCKNVPVQDNGKVFTTANCAVIEMHSAMQAKLAAFGRPKEVG